MASAWGGSWSSAWGNSWGTVVTSAPDLGQPIPGGGYDPRRRDDDGFHTRRIDYEERDRIAQEFRALYRDIYERVDPDSEVAEQASALVAEFTPTNAADFPPASVVDWAAVVEEGQKTVAKFRETLNALQAKIEVRRKELADDEEAIALLLLSI